MPATTPRPTRACRHRAQHSATLGLLLAAVTALPATAEVVLPRADAVVVGADLDNTVNVEEVQTSSDGAEARATLRVNRIERSKARGSLTNTTEIGELTLRAEGRDAVSETVVGTIRDVEAGGSITNSVTIGSSVDIAIGDGARACTVIGTLGRANCR